MEMLIEGGDKILHIVVKFSCRKDVLQFQQIIDKILTDCFPPEGEPIEVNLPFERPPKNARDSGVILKAVPSSESETSNE